jgi:hypothetical protein
MDKDLKVDENYYYFGIRQEICVDPAEHETMLPNGPSLQPEHKMFADEQSRFYKTQEKRSVACEIEVNGLGCNEKCVMRAIDGNRLRQKLNAAYKLLIKSFIFH